MYRKLIAYLPREKFTIKYRWDTKTHQLFEAKDGESKCIGTCSTEQIARDLLDWSKDMVFCAPKTDKSGTQ